MPRHNVIYVDTIVCLSEGHQGLSRCIVGHPTRVTLTSPSRGKNFHRSIKGAYNWKHSCVRSLLLSPRWSNLGAKNISLPSVLLCHLSADLLYVYNIVLQLGEFLSPPLLKITNCLVLSLLTNASLFDSQLNCHSDKWPINALHSSAISVVTSMRAPQVTVTVCGINTSLWYGQNPVIPHLLSTIATIPVSWIQIFSKLNWNLFFVFSLTCT